LWLMYLESDIILSKIFISFSPEEMVIQTMQTTAFNTKTSISYLPNSLHLPAGQERTQTGTMLFQCEVMFGSPSSNCGGNGICKIVARDGHSSLAFQRTSCSHAKAFFASSDGGESISLVFRREWLCGSLMRRHFRHSILEMPEPCPIPPAVINLFGLKMNELPAGLHIIEDYKTYFRITFRHTDLI